MRDHHDDLVFQALRHHWRGDIGRLAGSIGYAFERLQARLYDAPWTREPKAGQAACPKRFTVV